MHIGKQLRVIIVEPETVENTADEPVETPRITDEAGTSRGAESSEAVAVEG